jgi:hypothetical protein
MHLDYLGDAFDHWKGSVIGRLHTVLRGLRVVPMFTDLIAPGNPWTDAHLETYASLLQVPNGVIMSDRGFDRDTRETYFGDELIKGDFDLFLDPDTGFCRNGRDPRYVTLRDLRTLMPDQRAARLVMLYHHGARTDRRAAAARRIRVAKTEFPGAFVWWSGGVSMVFVSRSQQRLDEAKGKLREWLPPCYCGHGGAQCRLVDG